MIEDEIYDEPRQIHTADGRCCMCPKPVPFSMPNKFYCSWSCADLAKAYYLQFEPSDESDE